MSPTRGDRQTFKNEDLVLNVTTNIDPVVWDEARYEAFIDELCGVREYQKDAIRTGMRYMAGGKYPNLRGLAEENFRANDEMEKRYGSWKGMEGHLQLPYQLACSLDMATGTGKSYVLYGIAAMLLAEGTGRPGSRTLSLQYHRGRASGQVSGPGRQLRPTGLAAIRGQNQRAEDHQCFRDHRRRFHLRGKLSRNPAACEVVNPGQSHRQGRAGCSSE